MSIKTRKRTLFTLISIIVIGILSLSIYTGMVTYEKSDIKIGVIGHFSGNYASYGLPMKNAAQLAIEETNKNGGINGKEIQIIIEDDNGDPNKAATAMNKLVSIDKTNYIISAQGSGVTSAISQIAQNNQKVLMITLGSAPELTHNRDYVFRSIDSDTYQGTKINEFISENFNTQKVAGLYLNDAYGIGIKNIISKNMVEEEMFESGESDFRTHLLKIKNKDPDVLVIVAHQEYPTILRQVHELDIDATIIAAETFKDEKILQESSSTAEGVYTLFIEESVDYLDFSEKYTQRFGEDPSAYSKYAYDGTIALIKAIEESKDPEDVKDNLLYVEFNGASGRVGFDVTGDRTGLDYGVYLVKKNKFVKVL